MRHVYECPVRWADLDLLGHVNNVIYIDYLQEARIDMLLTHAPDTRAIDLAEGVVVVNHDVKYLQPLTFRPAPVKIDTWVTEIKAGMFTMAYEVYDETDAGRVVYLQAKSVLTPYVFAEERPRRISATEREVLTGFLGEDPFPPTGAWGPSRRDKADHYPLQVRFSDVDIYRHVNNVKYFEYYQEGRINFMYEMAGSSPDLPEFSVVLAQMGVEYRRPILLRTEPYAVHSWIARVGNSSFVVESEIVDGDEVLSKARAVLVLFDKATQKAAPPSEEARQVLLRHLAD